MPEGKAGLKAKRRTSRERRKFIRRLIRRLWEWERAHVLLEAELTRLVEAEMTAPEDRSRMKGILAHLEGAMSATLTTFKEFF